MLVHQRQQSSAQNVCFGTDTGSQALTPFVDCAINDVLLQPLPHVNQLLLQVGYVMDLRL